jgi:hypothetical protein
MSSSTKNPPDRYISYKGIDCMAQADAIVDRVLVATADPAVSNELWDRFRTRIEAARAGIPGAPDALFLVCSHTYYLHDLFDDLDDAEGDAMVQRIEDECC